MEAKRINKYLAECGVASRREADRMIAEQRVLINGQLAGPGDKVYGSEEILLDGKPVRMTTENVMLAFYKPVGVVVTNKDKHAEKTIMECIDYPQRLTYAGRLDKDSEGLLLLTNDGDFINEAMRSKNYHEKEYVVRLNRSVKRDDLERLSKGIFLKDLEVKTRPCSIKQTGKDTVTMILTQGLNRQIRRMWKAVGYEVISLKRIRVINVELGMLMPGEWREIKGKELEELYQSVGLKIKK